MIVHRNGRQTTNDSRIRIASAAGWKHENNQTKWRRLNAGDSVFMRHSRSVRSAGCRGPGSSCRYKNSETYLRQEMPTRPVAILALTILIVRQESLNRAYPKCRSPSSEDNIYWKLDC